MGRCAKDLPAADTNIFSGMPKVTCCGCLRQGTEVMEDQLGVEFVSDPRDRFYGFSFRAAARIGFAHSGTRSVHTFHVPCPEPSEEQDPVQAPFRSVDRL